jgi:hypothetical protein
MTAHRRRGPTTTAPEGQKRALDASGADFPSNTVWETFAQTERAFQASVVRYARLMGWATYHTFDSRRSDAGFPDLVLVRRPRVVFAELKSQRGRLRPAQRAWIEELRACGQAVYVWRPSQWREIEGVLR